MKESTKKTLKRIFDIIVTVFTARITPNEWLKQCPCFDALLDYEDLQPEGLF